MAISKDLHIDTKIFHCVTTDILTDEVIITDERIRHIEERHPGDFEKIEPFLSDILNYPDYILEDKNPSTCLVLKVIEKNNLRIQAVLRIHTSIDPDEYKNSILSAWIIGAKRWNSYEKNKKVLYKRE